MDWNDEQRAGLAWPVTKNMIQMSSSHRVKEEQSRGHHMASYIQTNTENSSCRQLNQKIALSNIEEGIK